MEKGKKEGLIKIALNMLMKGYNLKDIADLTGLSADETAALSDKEK